MADGTADGTIEVMISTMDGSLGYHGTVTDMLGALLRGEDIEYKTSSTETIIVRSIQDEEE